MTTINQLETQLLTEFNNGKTLSQLHHILNQYDGNDWKNYVQFNDTKYNRIKIPTLLSDNQIFEIIIICWKKDQQSQIHDHPENGCLLKLLDGKLQETKYKKYEDSLYPTDTNIFDLNEPNNTSYLCGKFGLHSIKALENSVSIHIYSPINYIPVCYIK